MDKKGIKHSKKYNEEVKKIDKTAVKLVKM